VALESTFQGLGACLLRLHDALNVLEITLGDKPPNDESAVADGVETVVLDIMGTLHESRQAAVSARSAVGHPVDLDGARRSLMACHGCFHHIEQQFSSGLASYDQLRELARLGNTRRAWQAWSSMVRSEIAQCQPLMLEASRALSECWQELVEHGGQTSISIRTETLGQKILTKGAREVIRN
jgi:hypothetical protein